ncbi:MAG: hypothetical protein KJ550_00350 [Proteobacteria bacterium]|nr:hypothetical protein [Desulfobacteraceae bacterium]MBU4011900.1 hypothetical protein [Pseudomonadota bacterium]MBU4066761.1 hypothetical protein [Pseudomonadota bacterium]MBU4102174.1 hypothetical protein [Pseudomonadota bacterium]
MRKITLLFLFLLMFAGCAGIDIKPITAERAQNAHETGTDDKGYIVYSPLVIIEIKEEAICIEKNASGTCVKSEIGYKAEKFTDLLPDYSKPFLVRPRSGFGKTDVELSIKDGWCLDSVKDKSDNTAVLDNVIKALKELTPIPAAKQSKSSDETKRGPKPGLYRLKYSKERNLELVPLLIY